MKIVCLDSLPCTVQGVLCNTKYSSFGSIKKMKQRLRSPHHKHTVPYLFRLNLWNWLIIHINVSRKQRCTVLGMKCYLFCTWWQCYHYPKLIYYFFQERQWMVINQRYQKVGVRGFAWELMHLTCFDNTLAYRASEYLCMIYAAIFPNIVWTISRKRVVRPDICLIEYTIL